MFSLAKPQHAHREAFFGTHIDMLDPGVAVAPGDSVHDVAALRQAVNACQALVRDKLPVLFDFTEVSKLRAGLAQISSELRLEVQRQAEGNPRIASHRIEFLGEEVLARGKELFELASNQDPHVVTVQDALGLRTLRDAGRSLTNAFRGKDGQALLQQSQELSQRFGLASLRLAGEDSMSDRELSRSMSRSTADLARACKTMGIVEKDFGGGSLALTVDPHLGQMQFNGGFQRSLGTAGVEIAVDPSQPGVAGILVHEYVHKLDAALGAKALQVFDDAHGIQGPPYRDERSLFSNLTSEQRSILPLAKDGLDRIFSTLGVATTKQIDHDEAFEAAAHTLAARTFGVSRLLSAPAPQMESWIQAVRDDDDSLLRGLAAKVTRMPLSAMVHQFFEDHQADKGKEHAFVCLLRSQGIDPKSEKVGAAFKRLHPDIEKLAVALHPALPEGMAPSPFLKASINASAHLAKRASWERRDVLSTSHEVLARLVGRPSSLREMGVAFLKPARASPLGASELKQLNEGFLKMSQAGGVRSTADGPRLSFGHEIAVARTVTPVFKAMQHAAHAVMFLSGQTGSAATRHARKAP